jgi:hypothetical protein
LFLRLFNHVGGGKSCGEDSKADFFREERFANFGVSGQRREPGRFPMTFVGKLSVVAAYVAFAFVGAIVLGVI